MLFVLSVPLYLQDFTAYNYMNVPDYTFDTVKIYFSPSFHKYNAKNS